jgi:hypothetical protein
LPPCVSFNVEVRTGKASALEAIGEQFQWIISDAVLLPLRLDGDLFPSLGRLNSHEQIGGFG